MRIDRTTRQGISKQRIFALDVRCILLACTGYGKTRVGIEVGQELKEKNPNLTIVVIVPSDVLRTQWKAVLRFYELEGEVLTIHEAITKKELRYDYCILDEVHRYILAEEFSNVFNILRVKHCLGLSATLTKEEIQSIEELLPIADTITLKDARKNGWVSEYIQFNLWLNLPEKEQAEYKIMHDQIDKYFAYFEDRKPIELGGTGRRFAYEKLIACRRTEGARAFILEQNIQEYNENKKLIPFDILVKLYIQRANHCSYLIQQRLKIVNESQVKLEAAYLIIKQLDKKSVTFGKSINFAENLRRLLGDSAVAYHSEIESRMIDEDTLVEYGIEKPTQAYLKRLDKRSNPGLFDLKPEVPMRKVGKDRLKELYIKWLDAGYIKHIVSAESINEGFDCKGMEVGIVVARDKSRRKLAQQTGRVIRDEKIDDENKIALMFHIILNNTIDKGKALEAQVGAGHFVDVYSVNEALQYYYEYIR